MIARLQNHAVAITIGVSFFMFGFFVMVNLLAMTEREIAIGLVSGSIGGLTILLVVLWNERKQVPSPSPLY